MSSFYITKVRTPEDISAIAELFTAYTKWLNLDLTFQNFTDELASLPGKYSPPHGELLLARQSTSTTPLGCVAVRPLFPPGVCEFKRLYVAPHARGLGLGKALVKEVLKAAKDLGYNEGRLDTLPQMKAAIDVYAKLGFKDCEKYYETPIEGTRFLAATL